MSMKRARTLTEVDDALAGLARAVERHSRMLTTGRGETAALAATVEQLATTLRAATTAWATTPSPADTSPGDTAPGGAGQDADSSGDQNPENPDTENPDTGESEESQELPSWLLTTEFEPGHGMAEALGQWVRSVYLRWPDARLPACWPLHPWVVEELWVLRCCWWTARAGDTASWLRWQDWHDRHRPATARRIADGLQHCAPDRHVPATGGPYPVVPGADVLPIAVTAWATVGHQAWPPTLAAELLDEPGQGQPHSGNRRPPGSPRRTLTSPTQTRQPGPHSTSQTAG